MSIVGTRPPTLDEWNKYELHHRARLARSNSSTIRLSDSPYEKRKSVGTENGMFGQEALFLL